MITDWMDPFLIICVIVIRVILSFANHWSLRVWSFHGSRVAVVHILLLFVSHQTEDAV